MICAAARILSIANSLPEKSDVQKHDIAACCVQARRVCLRRESRVETTGWSPALNQTISQGFVRLLNCAAAPVAEFLTRIAESSVASSSDLRSVL
jgi:hypothetical protein